MISEEVDEPGPEGDVGMADHYHPYPAPGGGGHPGKNQIIILHSMVWHLWYNLLNCEKISI